jgi:hypothetical protein
MTEDKKTTTDTGIKGFDKQLRCGGMQYEFNKEAKADGKLSLCNNGIHYVKDPLDAFTYYPPAKSRYAEVEASGVSDETGEDSNRVCSSIVLKVELSFKAMAQAAVKFIRDKVAASKETSATAGDYAHAATAGDYAHAATAGAEAHAATAGAEAHAATAGRDCISVAMGVLGAARAAKGSWIVCAEWKQNSDCTWSIVGVKTAKVDGKKIEAGKFYKLKGGKFVKVDPQPNCE